MKSLIPQDDVIKWKHFQRYWPFVRGIQRSSVNFPHKGQWRGALVFSTICACINGWVNNGEAGDFRRHRAHYDLIYLVLAPKSSIMHVRFRNSHQGMQQTLYSTKYAHRFVSRGQVWPSDIVVACVCPSVRPSVTKFVRAITHYPFKLGSPNLDHRCKRPWLRSLLFFGLIDRDLQCQFKLQSQNLPKFELVSLSAP